MTDDQVHQEEAENELEFSAEAIDDLEVDEYASEAVTGGKGGQGSGLGAGKAEFDD